MTIDRDIMIVDAEPGRRVTIRNVATKDVVGYIDVPHIPAAEDERLHSVHARGLIWSYRTDCDECMRIMEKTGLMPSRTETPLELANAQPAGDAWAAVKEAPAPASEPRGVKLAACAHCILCNTGKSARKDP